MSKRTYYIDRFDRGIQQSKRVQFENPNVLGFTHCAHFDVFTDPKRMIPMPGFEDQRGTANAADVLDLGGIGGNATKVYAVGKAVSNWYGQDWEYRVQITPDGAYSTGTQFLTVDLSNMPASFWSNVKTNGGDLRVTASDGITEKAVHFGNFDTVAETGTLYFNTGGTLDSSYYVYYGNADAQGYLETDTYGAENVFGNLTLAYTLDPDDQYLNMADISAYELTGTGSDYNGVSSPVGGGSDNIRWPNLAPTSFGNSFTISFLINRGTYSGLPSVLWDFRGALRCTQTAGNTLQFLLSHTSGSNTYTTSSALSASTWTVVTVAINGNDIDVWFDDTQVVNATAAENGTLDYSNSNFEISLFGDEAYDMIVASTNTFSSGEVSTYANNLIDNANFWTIGSEATFTALNKTYDTLQLYSKDHGATDWSAVHATTGQPALSRNDYPTQIPVLVSGDLTVFFSQDAASNGNVHINTFSPTSGISLRLQNLSTVGNRYPAFAVGADNIAYVGYGQKIYAVTAGAATEVFDTGKDIWSVTAFRDLLAIATEADEKNITETYDFARTDPISTIDFGPGEVMLITEIGGYLVGVSEQSVLDVFETGSTNDGTLPGGMSFMLSGGGDAEEAIFHDTETKVDPTDAGRKPPISQYSFPRKRSVVALGYFDDNDEKKGIWELGINSVGRLALNMLVVMPNTYAWDHIWGGYNFIYMKEGNANNDRVYRLKNGDVTGDYDQTSFFETTAIGVDRPGTKRQVKTITVGAFARQGFTGTVTVKYKSNRKSGSWTTLLAITDFDNDGSSETIRKTVKRTTTGNVLPTAEEIQFRVESTGGIELTEFEVEVEEMNI